MVKETVKQTNNKDTSNTFNDVKHEVTVAEELNRSWLDLKAVWMWVLTLMSVGILISSILTYGLSLTNNHFIPAAGCELGFSAVGLFLSIIIIISTSYSKEKTYKQLISAILYTFTVIVGIISVTKTNMVVMQYLNYVITVFTIWLVYDNLVFSIKELIYLNRDETGKLKFIDAKGELREALSDEKNLKLEDQPLSVQEQLVSSEKHEHEDHYHGIHHFDKFGHHDDIKPSEFTLKTQLPKSKRSLTFRVAMTGLVLGLSIAMSVVDMFVNIGLVIGDVKLDIRIFDLIVIIAGIPIVGLWGSIGIAIIEPWFHLLIDGDHTPIQIALDSVCYAATVVMFFFIYYIAFKNSPIHKEPNKKKRIFKWIVPGTIIIPIESVLFTLDLALSIWGSYKTSGQGAMVNNWHSFQKNWDWLIWADLGIQFLRFCVVYVAFVAIDNVMKPVNHRYR